MKRMTAERTLVNWGEIDDGGDAVFEYSKIPLNEVKDYKVIIYKSTGECRAFDFPLKTLLNNTSEDYDLAEIIFTPFSSGFIFTYDINEEVLYLEGALDDSIIKIFA